MLKQQNKYAIIEVSGKQFWVTPGSFYDLDRLPFKIGSEISLNRILYAKNQDEISFGQPFITSMKIKGTILRHLQGKKILVYKMRTKKKTRIKNGYRHQLTRIFIDSVQTL